MSFSKVIVEDTLGDIDLGRGVIEENDNGTRFYGSMVTFWMLIL